MQTLFLTTLENYKEVVQSPLASFLHFPTLLDFETKELPELVEKLLSYLRDEIKVRGGNQISYTALFKLSKNEKWCFLIMNRLDRDFKENSYLVGLQNVSKFSGGFIKNLINSTTSIYDKNIFVGIDQEDSLTEMKPHNCFITIGYHIFIKALVPTNNPKLNTFWKNIASLAKKINSVNNKQNVFEYNDVVFEQTTKCIKKITFSNWDIGFAFLEYCLNNKKKLFAQKIIDDDSFNEIKIVFDSFKSVYESLMKLKNVILLEDLLAELKVICKTISSLKITKTSNQLQNDCSNLLNSFKDDLKAKYNEFADFFDQVLFFSPSKKYLIKDQFTNSSFNVIKSTVDNSEINDYLNEISLSSTLSYWANQTKYNSLRSLSKGFIGFKINYEHWEGIKKDFDLFRSKDIKDDIISNLMVARANAGELTDIINRQEDTPRRKPDENEEYEIEKIEKEEEIEEEIEEVVNANPPKCTKEDLDLEYTPSLKGDQKKINEIKEEKEVGSQMIETGTLDLNEEEKEEKEEKEKTTNKSILPPQYYRHRALD